MAWSAERPSVLPAADPRVHRERRVLRRLPGTRLSNPSNAGHRTVAVRRRAIATGVRIALCSLALAAQFGCGASPITAVRIERAFAPTFANLVHLQLSRMGLPSLAPSDINVKAACRKLVPEAGPAGA